MAKIADGSRIVPALQLNGKVMHVFQAPEFKDKATGEVKTGKWKVQLLANLMLRNGQYKLDVIDLSTDKPDYFEARQGQDISVPVDTYVIGKTVGFYVLGNSLPA